jgi:hypothetical protein
VTAGPGIEFKVERLAIHRDGAGTLPRSPGPVNAPAAIREPFPSEGSGLFFPLDLGRPEGYLAASGDGSDSPQMG